MPEYTVIDGAMCYDDHAAFERDGACWCDDEYCVEWSVVASDNGYQLARRFISCDPHSESGWEVTPEAPISAEEFRRWISGDASPFDGENSGEVAAAISQVLGMVA
jgi:hypothetical protein